MNKEFDVKNQLQKERREIETFDELVNFLNKVKNNYNTSYENAPRAIAQAALAVSFYLAKEFGITGFQAGFVMWDFIRDWKLMNNKTGMKLIDYDDMLYPQYDYKFDKTISKYVFESLQKEALNLYNNENPCERVKKHLESIINGEVPFGYIIKD